MKALKIVAEAVAMTVSDHAGMILSAFMTPKINKAVSTVIPTPKSRWLTEPLWTEATIDGAVLSGSSARAGAKFAIPKGLPEEGERSLAIENEPHYVDGFDGVIDEGYGKGTKSLLADETVVIKVKGKSFLSRMNYHVHDAERAGLHYDLAIEDLSPGTPEFEMHIPRGPYKGRWSFITTPKGMVVSPMKDRGQVIAKPSYQLKKTELFNQIETNRGDWIVEQKMDGSLGNAVFKGSRVAFRSHRDTPGAQTYYDRIPAIEFVGNSSPWLILRYSQRGPRLDGTVLQGEIFHSDGASRTSGILNALPQRAQEIQARRGPVRYYAWDIVKLRGRDVSHLPYGERRRLLEQVIREVRLFNRNWDIARKAPRGMSVQQFYDDICSQPLPYGEGIVIKNASDPSGKVWFKVKQTDLLDLEILGDGFVEGEGKYAGSLGALTVRNPQTGATGEVGTGFTDYERGWIWEHKDMLEGAVIKVRVMEETDTSFRAPVFHSFHEGKGNTEAGLLMYAESLAGGDPEEALRTKYALISAQGWRR